MDKEKNEQKYHKKEEKAENEMLRPDEANKTNRLHALNRELNVLVTTMLTIRALLLLQHNYLCYSKCLHCYPDFGLDLWVKL